MINRKDFETGYFETEELYYGTVEVEEVFEQTGFHTDCKGNNRSLTDVKKIVSEIVNENGFRLGSYYVPNDRKAFTHGSQAKVFDCYHDEEKKTYVAKIYSKEHPDIDNIRKVNKKIMQLSSESIAHIYAEGDTVDGEFYMVVMEKYQELPENFLKFDTYRKNRMFLVEFMEVVKDLTDGLKELHRANIFHSDIKPQNIMCRDDKYGRKRAVLIDFGSCVEVHNTSDEAYKQANGRALTMAYLPPEQTRVGCHINEKTDYYALGVTLAQFLSGTYPFLKNGMLVIPLGTPREIQSLLGGLLYYNAENPENINLRWGENQVEAWLKVERDKRNKEAHGFFWESDKSSF